MEGKTFIHRSYKEQTIIDKSNQSMKLYMYINIYVRINYVNTMYGHVCICVCVCTCVCVCVCVCMYVHVFYQCVVLETKLSFYLSFGKLKLVPLHVCKQLL